MEIERVEETKKAKRARLLLLVFNIAMVITGGTAAGLLIRLYFLHGGSRKWLAAGLQTAGFPFLLIPLLFSYIRRGCRSPFLHLTPPVLLWCAFLGLLTGADNFLYSYGASSLPVSTSSLLLATQLGFTALFSFLLVRQRFTDFSVNAVVLLTLGAAVIGVHAGGDRPEGLSQRKYFLGFFLTLAAAVTYSCVPPLLQLMYAKASRHPVAYALVVETQLAIGFFATAFCAIGMALNHDFQAIGREAREYGLGEAKYYVAIISIAFVSNMFLLGLVGTINGSSALLSGITVSVCLPATERSPSVGSPFHPPSFLSSMGGAKGGGGSGGKGGGGGAGKSGGGGGSSGKSGGSGSGSGKSSGGGGGMMHAPGGTGYISRASFESNPQGYFQGLHHGGVDGGEK